MGTTEGGTTGGARARFAFMIVSAALCVVIILASGMEWGSLSVRRQLVVSEPGTGQWQGVLALCAAITGLLIIGFAIARGRGRIAALAALVAGLVVAASAVAEMVHVATRPSDLAEVVKAGAKAIDLRGYRIPLIESGIGAGAWVALAAGVLLAVVGLAGLVVPAWRARR